MFPLCAMNDMLDGMVAHAVSCRKCPQAKILVPPLVFLADGANLFFCQFGTSSLDTEKQSSLSGCIQHIDRLCSEKMMARILAGTVIATMADTKILWNGAVGNRPRDAMSTEMKIFARHSSPDRKDPIAHAVSAARPRPALVQSSDANLRPEPKNVLLRQGWDATIRSTHDGLLTGRCVRTACGQSAGRSFQVDYTKGTFVGQEQNN